MKTLIRLFKWFAPRRVPRTSTARFNTRAQWWCGPCEQEVPERNVYDGGECGPRHRGCNGPCEITWTEL